MLKGIFVLRVGKYFSSNPRKTVHRKNHDKLECIKTITFFLSFYEKITSSEKMTNKAQKDNWDNSTTPNLVFITEKIKHSNRKVIMHPNHN